MTGHKRHEKDINIPLRMRFYHGIQKPKDIQPRTKPYELDTLWRKTTGGGDDWIGFWRTKRMWMTEWRGHGPPWARTSWALCTRWLRCPHSCQHLSAQRVGLHSHRPLSGRLPGTTDLLPQGPMYLLISPAVGFSTKALLTFDKE